MSTKSKTTKTPSPSSTTSTSSTSTSLNATTSNCIAGFIEYVKSKGSIKGVKKWQDCNETTVVECLMEIMVQKGFTNLNFILFNELVNYLATDDAPNRDYIFNKIAKWADKTLSLQSTKQLRNSVTVSGASLTKATQQYDLTYTGTMYIDTKGTVTPLSQDERDWCTTITDPKDDSTPPKELTFTSGNKKECAKCWICGKPIYLYELMVGEKPFYVKCGEDEHVLPPGVGNVFGLLYPTLKQQMDKLAGSFKSKALRASHAWCNQVKSGYNLIVPPTVGAGGTYQLNETSLGIIKNKATEWLKQGKDRAIGIEYFQHDMANTSDETKRTEYITEINTKITEYITDLCKAFNDSPDISKDTYVGSRGTIAPSIMYQLRLIFFSCCLAKDVLFKNDAVFQAKWLNLEPKSGGGSRAVSNSNMIGGDPTDTDLDNLAMEILDEAGKEECLTVENLINIETKNIYNPNKNYYTHTYYDVYTDEKLYDITWYTGNVIDVTYPLRPARSINTSATSSSTPTSSTTTSSTTSSATTSSATTSSATMDSDPSDPWVKRYDKDAKNYYYINRFRKPDIYFWTKKDINQYNIDNSEWSVIYDENKKKYFYYNKYTKESLWPRVFKTQT